MPTVRHQPRRRAGSWRQLRSFPLGRRLWIGTLAVVPPDTTSPVTGSYVLEWDLDGDGNYDDEGEDLTCYLVEVSYRMGRDQPSPLPGRAQAGRLQMRLNNDDGRFSPDNASGPLYGMMGPHRKVRLRSTSPYAADLFTGWTNGEPQPAASIGGHPTATIEALGPLGQLAEAFTFAHTEGDPTITVFGSLLSGSLAVYLGTPEESASAYQNTAAWGTELERAMIPIRLLEDLELGFVYERPDGTVQMDSRQFRTTVPRATVVQATFSDVTGSPLSYDQIERLPTSENIANRVTVERVGFTLGSLGVLWQNSERLRNLSDATLHTEDFIATYPGASGPAGAFVNAWTTPVVGTDITYTGDAPTVTLVETTAHSMRFTVQNTAGQSTQLYLVQARGIPNLGSFQEYVQGDDTASQAANGLRDYRVAGVLPYEDYDAAAAAVADWLARFATPHTLVALEFTANRHSLAFTQAVRRRVSDRIHVTATGPRTMLGIDQDFFIEAISGKIDFTGRRHRIRFELSGA